MSLAPLGQSPEQRKNEWYPKSSKRATYGHRCTVHTISYFEEWGDENSYSEFLTLEYIVYLKLRIYYGNC